MAIWRFSNQLSREEVFDTSPANYNRFDCFSFKETRDMAYLSADDADRIIKQKAQQQMDNVAKAFLAFDRDGNGVVTKKEMRKVLYRFQIPMEKEEFNKLWDRYVQRRNVGIKLSYV